jgi:8-oxo-dGTP pyrophosphatase MutT (NUDIX family)
VEPLKQFAVLPFVEGPEGWLVLLVSSRGSGRWVIPKGWPKAGMTGRELAALEAFQEAGIGGDVGDDPIGSYDYTKRLHYLAWAKCRVVVYPMKVAHQFLRWPEQSSRRQTWVGPEQAADLVRERGLAQIFLQLVTRLGAAGASEPSSGPPPG